MNIDQFGYNGDLLEAQMFAYLAVRSLKKLPLSTPNTTGVNKSITGGYLYS
jgi:anhydro-N-acetylmuramic acid kinase